MFQRVAMISMLLIIVLGGGFYAYKELMPTEVEEASGPVYATKDVVRGDISVGVEVTGTLDSSKGSSIRVPGESRYDGGSTQFAINEVLVEEGDAVKSGDVIARLDSTDIESKIDDKQDLLDQKLDQLADMTGVDVSEVERINPAKGITLRAPIDGRIIDLDVSEGEELDLGHVICRVVDDSKFRAKIKLNTFEYQLVKEGQKVVLSSPEFDGFYDAVITKLNSNPVPNYEDEDESSSDDEFARGFVYMGEVEGDNPGLIQRKMEVSIGLRDENNSNSIRFFSNKGEVEEFLEEESVLNTIESIITDVHVDDMESVKKGTPIVTMASKEIQDMIEEKLEEIRDLREEVSEYRSKLDQLEITTPVDGILSYFEIQVGDTVRSGQWIGSIFNVESMQMWAEVDDIDILNVKLDAPVRVTIDALPGEILEGKVANVDTRGNRGDGGITKYSVYIDVKGNSQLKPGMQAKGFIDAGSAKDVLLVPMEGVFEEEGKTMVEILDDDGNAKVVPVKLGLMNNKVAEIKEGVKEGDKIITGSSADLLPSQHIGSKDTILPDAKDDEGNSTDNGEGK